MVYIGNDVSNQIVSGLDCLLLNESTAKRDYISIPIIQRQACDERGELSATSAWDSTQHDSIYLNQQTLHDQYIYLVLKIKLKLKEPFEHDIIVRKRLCVQIYLSQQAATSYLTSRLTKFIANNETTKRLLNVNPSDKKSTINSTGLIVYIISNIPKALEERESRDSLAIVAAVNHNYADPYRNAIENDIDTILASDHKRQEFILKKRIQRHSYDLESQSNKSVSSSDDSKRTGIDANLFLSKTLTAMSGSLKSLNSSLTMTPKKNPIIHVKNEISSQSDHSQTKVLNGSNEIRQFQTNISPIEGVVQANKQSDGLKEDSNPVEHISKVEEESQTDPQETSMDSLNVRIEQVDKPISYERQQSHDDSRLLDSSLASNKMSLKAFSFDLQNLSHSPSNTSISSSLSEMDLSKLPDWAKLDAHVVVSTNHVLNKPGQIRFIGDVRFAKGLWIGVELERPNGMNDGSVKGHKYFDCEPNKGVFVKLDKLMPNKLYCQNNSQMVATEN